jgi:hypothetical protein
LCFEVINAEVTNTELSLIGGAQHGPALRETSAHGIVIIAMGTLSGGKTGGIGGIGGKSGMGLPVSTEDKGKNGGKGGISFPILSRRQLGGMGGKGGIGGMGGKGGIGGMGSDTKLMEEAFSWIEKNAGIGKFVNVDKSRVAVAGQSCGGLESFVSLQVLTLNEQKKANCIPDITSLSTRS